MTRSFGWQVCSLAIVGWLSACGVTPASNAITQVVATQRPSEVPNTPTLVSATATSVPTATPVPTLVPTHSPSTVTPQIAPTVAAIGAQSIHIPTSAGSPIYGELLGSGATAVIFSVMGSCKPGWTELAQEVADRGFVVLTYRWRACHGNRIDNREIRMFVDDTRAAIQYMRDQGAQRIILVGASLGGCASAKLLTESQADGLVVIASPPTIPAWGFQITAADVNAKVPKLFITSEDDATVPASATRALYELAVAPREWQTYAGSAHGTDIFAGDQGAVLAKRILAFIDTIEKS